MGKKPNNLTGIRFCRWTVVGDSGKRDKGNILWDVVCDCGSTRTMRADNLKSGVSRSCGCLGRSEASTRSTVHGKCMSGAWRSWVAMLARCESESATGYVRYGACGISVCERWHDFRLFYEDMGDRPKGHSIDRIDNSRGYEPGNCRWANTTSQNRNRRSCYNLLFRGEIRQVWEISKMTGVSADNIRQRMKVFRMTLDEAVCLPLRARIPAPCGDHI